MQRAISFLLAYLISLPMVAADLVHTADIGLLAYYAPRAKLSGVDVAPAGIR